MATQKRRLQPETFTGFVFRYFLKHFHSYATSNNIPIVLLHVYLILFHILIIQPQLSTQKMI